MTIYVYMVSYNEIKVTKTMGRGDFVDEIKNDKVERVLGIYTKLINGSLVYKPEEAVNYNVNERSIQRDIDDIRNFLDIEAEHNGLINEIIYDREEKGYRLKQIYKSKLTNGEILSISKILLDSRAFTKEDMSDVISKLIDFYAPKDNQKIVSDLINNELYHYVELKHKKRLINDIWDIGQAIKSRKYLIINYLRMKDRKIVTRKIKPVAIMFSEYYFYLAAFIDDNELRKDFEVSNDCFPTIYRIDRIKDYTVCDEHFHIPYSSRFNEGEFRKRIQFMYGGKLQKVKFKYLGNDVDSILDRLPTAEIISEKNGAYILSAEVFGKGINMWIKSQGENVEVL